MTTDKEALLRDLMPTGRLRIAINFGNPVLVQRAEDGTVRGVSPALARELTRRLGLEAELVLHERAGEVFESGRAGAWDVCFLAIEPKRAAEISFTAPYVIIAGTYVVAEDSDLADVAGVDQAGVRIAVSQGSAYDLFLTRSLKHATIERVIGADAVMQALVEGRVEVAAGIRQPMEAFVAATPGYHVIPEPFMEIRQAMGVPAGRPVAAAFLKAFVEEMKASGFVRRTLDQNGQEDVAVGPPAAPR